MDPVSLVVSAVVLGASAGLKDTAAAVVKDSYAAVKGLLVRRRVDVSAVEKKPDSKSKQDSLREDLADLDGGPDAVDDELLAAARGLVDAVAAQEPDAGAAVGVDLERVRAEFLRIEAVRSEGTGVRVRDGQFSGGIDVGRVDAGRPSDGAAGPSGR